MAGRAKFLCGTVFEITPEGVLTTPHSFEGTVAFTPYAGLLQATDDMLYGTPAEDATSSSERGREV